ncbi:MAG TPA: DUF86 domain-containing protein [Anaerohalosphaeraceae bacterium]|nr:DUF86 domain-containing protein [Anaerohalosphaeraceae bacterium]
MQIEKRSLLEDILRAAESIEPYTRGKILEHYLEDDQLQASVERKFEIIGEAMSRLHKLDAQITEQIEDSRKIIAFRNILIHGYSAVDNRVVWDIVKYHIPRLLKQVRSLLD